MYEVPFFQFKWLSVCQTIEEYIPVLVIGSDGPPKRGVTALTRAVSGEKQMYSGNLEISPGIGKPEKFSGKFGILSGHWAKIYFNPFIKLRFVIKHSDEIRMLSLWRTIWNWGVTAWHKIEESRVFFDDRKKNFIFGTNMTNRNWGYIQVLQELERCHFHSSQSPSYLRKLRKWKIFALSRGRVSQLVDKERGQRFKAPLVFQRNQVASKMK